MHIKEFVFAIAICIGLAVGFSCDNERFTTNPNDRLEFSTDTLRFDTIFSTIPSVTLQLKVYNRHSRAININRIWLENGVNTSFRFNADGYPSGAGKSLENIVVGAQDSIFVFVETTLKENSTDNPVYTAENLVFEANSQRQSVVLEAYGQDAVILRNHSLTTDETFTADKPYLIFGFLHVPQGRRLTLEAGTRIYIHKGDNIVLSTASGTLALENTCIVVEGNLVANGTTDKRILIRGDRFDLAYTNIPYSFLPSQWGSIYLVSQTGDNILNNTDIVGATNGVVMLGRASIPIKLKVENSIFHCIGGNGILSQFGDLNVVNSEISNCGGSAIAQLGGKMKIVHTTIANYMPAAFLGDNTSNEPALRIANFVKVNDIVTAFPITSTVVENSIIYGNRQSEIGLKDTLDISFNVFISNCLIKSPELTRSELHKVYWTKNVEGQIFEQTSPDFGNLKESGYFSFQLSDDSYAKDKANYMVANSYPLDLLGKSRLADTKPDLGAYEK